MNIPWALQQRNLHQTLVMMNRVTSFIPRAYMRVCVSHTGCKGTVIDSLEKMKLNGLEWYKLGRNPWQSAKHAWLYSDRLQALKSDRLIALGSAINFCLRSIPLQCVQKVHQDNIRYFILKGATDLRARARVCV